MTRSEKHNWHAPRGTILVPSPEGIEVENKTERSEDWQLELTQLMCDCPGDICLDPSHHHSSGEQARAQIDDEEKGVDPDYEADHDSTRREFIYGYSD